MHQHIENGHNHNHIQGIAREGDAKATRRLKFTLVLVLLVMLVEVIGGIISNSLSLLGDAGHMLVDVTALGMSLFALNLAHKAAPSDKTYGYLRTEIIAALANGVLLSLVAFYILYEAYQRILEPPLVRTPVMIAVAVVGLAANVVSIFLLHTSKGHSLNVRAAFWHVVSDTVSSVGVVIAGLVIMFTGWRTADVIIAVIISAIILFGAVRLVKESLTILLESVPKHISLEEVISSLRNVSGIEDVHDIHIWTITSGVYALSSHLQIKDQMVSRSEEIIAEVNRLLKDNFGISHSTLQLECESCPSGFGCGICKIELEENNQSCLDIVRKN